MQAQEKTDVPEPGQPGRDTVDVSFLIPARNATDSFRKTVSAVDRYLGERFNSYEIVLIPNPAPGRNNDYKDDHSVVVCEKIARDFSNTKVVSHFSPPGKGAALRTGIFATQGRWIYFTDADLPYDLEFFDRAASKLKQGYELVTGNRRVPESYFHVPVSLLHIAYSRHRLGLAFNRVARFLLPIKTTDTQAGIKAMTRELALRAFSLQSCPGFFFDLELILSARGGNAKHAEQTVTLYLNTEKSTVRVVRESILAVFWLARITLREFNGKYGRPSK
jgi:dolichyl-phosphate beta-glucosyltransferase